MFDKKKKKNQAKKSKKHTTGVTSSKRNTAPSSKQRGKKSTDKKAASGKQTKSAAPKEPKLKHNDKDEMTVDTSKPIIIGKAAKPKRRASRRELKRVAKVGGYTVFDGVRAGKTFATPQEAAAYAGDVLARTGEIVDVQKTDRQITHTFKASETEK